jgi:hypothetical protein
MAEMDTRTVTIAKQRFDLRRDTIERATRRLLPEPISSHYVVVGRRRFPPKQLIALATGLDRADFTSHQARRILMGLGFAVGRVPTTSRGRPNDPFGGSESGGSPRVASATSGKERRRELAETLAALPGQWVAIKDDELLVAAATPKELVGWLSRHNRRADSMFRVPEDEIAAGGLAPL